MLAERALDVEAMDAAAELETAEAELAAASDDAARLAAASAVERLKALGLRPAPQPARWRRPGSSRSQHFRFTACKPTPRPARSPIRAVESPGKKCELLDGSRSHRFADGNGLLRNGGEIESLPIVFHGDDGAALRLAGDDADEADGRFALALARAGNLNPVHDGIANQVRERASQNARHMRGNAGLLAFDLQAGSLAFLVGPGGD